MSRMSRGRYNQSNEWDSRDDSSVYEPQNFDDDSGGDLNLDHCRLYIKNVPKGLSEAGLRAAFSKFGMLCEAYLSPDLGKSFALIRYETPGEAKLAMMKMNNTEPLKLQIQIAKKSKAQGARKNKYWQDKGTNDMMERSDRSHGVNNRDRDESGSVSSRGRHSHFNTVSANKRSTTQLINQWRNMKNNAKKSEFAYRKARTTTGGGPPAEDRELIDAIPNEFTVDSNAYDADSIYAKQPETSQTKRPRPSVSLRANKNKKKKMNNFDCCHESHEHQLFVLAKKAREEAMTRDKEAHECKMRDERELHEGRMVLMCLEEEYWKAKIMQLK